MEKALKADSISPHILVLCESALELTELSLHSKKFLWIEKLPPDKLPPDKMPPNIREKKLRKRDQKEDLN